MIALAPSDRSGSRTNKQSSGAGVLPPHMPDLSGAPNVSRYPWTRAQEMSYISIQLTDLTSRRFGARV